MMNAHMAPFSPSQAGSPDAAGTVPRSRRTLAVSGGVLAAHAAALWTLQFSPPAPPQVAAPRVLAAQLVAPAPEALPAVPTPPAPSPRPRTQAATSQPTRPPVTPTAAEPSQAAEPTPAPTPVAEAPRDPAPIPSSLPAPSAPGPSAAAAHVAAPAAPAVAAAPPAPPPKIELPSASAAYLNNPPPAYPALSRRLGEQGRVVLRVRIEPEGTASAAEIRTSSGYERLDKAALEAVLRWRYVPGKRDGVPEAMWFLVPIQFVLE